MRPQTQQLPPQDKWQRVGKPSTLCALSELSNRLGCQESFEGHGGATSLRSWGLGRSREWQWMAEAGLGESGLPWRYLGLAKNP